MSTPPQTPRPAAPDEQRTTTAVATAGSPSASPMNRREVLEALSGILLGMFVSILATSVVSSSLPRIISDLGGTQSAFTWVVTATLLTTTISTPIWGKLADQFSKKLLVQTGLVIYVAGSLLAGTAGSMGVLIGARAVQGVGVELAFALFAWRRSGPAVAVLGGVVAGVLEGVVEQFLYYGDTWTMPYRLVYIGSFAVSGAVIAGLGGWALVRALARTGALSAFPAGREHRG